MTAKQMFNNVGTPAGKVVLCSKGRYDYGRDEFAYCICDDGTVIADKGVNA